jgi:hypothetical protein
VVPAAPLALKERDAGQGERISRGWPWV